jgi:Uma2 family endonuclease
MRSSGLATDRAEIYYPESDGKPMAEADLHRNEMFEIIDMLARRYADAPDVYVSGNLFLYYEEGNPRAVVAPDVLLVFGVPKRLRRTYKLWEEGVPPAVVIEVRSRKTRREDLSTKMALYPQLGIGEYYLYDPEGEYLRPALRGFQLLGDGYEIMVPDGTGALRSTHLGLDLRLVAGQLELVDVSIGQRLPRAKERDEALTRAEQVIDAERQRADLAETELARLRAELDRSSAGL